MDDELLKAIIRLCGGRDVTFDKDSADDLTEVIHYLRDQESEETLREAILRIEDVIQTAQLAQPGMASR